MLFILHILIEKLIGKNQQTIIICIDYNEEEEEICLFNIVCRYTNSSM